MGVLRSNRDKNSGRRCDGTMEEAKSDLQGNHDDAEPVANPADDDWLRGKVAVASLAFAMWTIGRRRANCHCNEKMRRSR